MDEHIPGSVAAGLRRRGIKVTTALEAGLIGADDATQLSFASAAGSVLVTHDADYLQLHSQGAAHAGIAYSRQGTLSIGAIIRSLTLLHDVLAAEDMASRVEYL